MITQLALQEVESNDCRFLRLADNSYYNPDLPVNNAILEVLVPGYTCSVSFNVGAGFNNVYNSSLLGIAPASTYTQLLSLPDGAYNIRYSIQPNDQLYVNYILFRNCQITQRYLGKSCKLFSEECRLKHKDFEHMRHKLVWIKELIDASKAMAEEEGDADKAIELYNEANRLIGNLDNCGC